MSDLILGGLLVLALGTALVVIQQRNLFAATILLGIYSLLMALVWTLMEALDVAFTEAAVGAGISTILMIGALVHVGSKERRGTPREDTKPSVHWPSLLAVVLAGGVMIYGTLDMPLLGDPDAPVHQRASAYYVSEESHERTHAPNIVTAVLASYRGFDTLFETAVIFVAGAGMILLLREERSPTKADEAPESPESTGGAA